MKKLLVAAFVVACSHAAHADWFSSEPTQAEMRSAINQLYADQMAAVASARPVLRSFSLSDFYRLNKIEKIDCTKESQKSYRCNVYLDISIFEPLKGLEQRGASTRRVLFVKTSSGWRVAEGMN